MRNLTIIISFILALNLSATIINVPAEQPSIQAGIDIAVESDTILVQPGTYAENINYNGKAVILGSLFLTTQDTIYISQTVIDGSQDGSVVTFESGEDSTSVLSGFTITNGYADSGGGIYCSYNSNPKLLNLVIMNNWSYYYGGGLTLLDCTTAYLDEIEFYDNQSGGNGGNLYISNSNLIVRDSKIKGGNAFSYGGGIICYDSILDLENVQICDNNSSFGAGIYSDGCNISLKKSMIISNGSETGSAIKGINSDIEIINCIIADNACFQSGVITCSASNEVYIINSILVNNSAQEPAESLFEGIDFIFNSILYNNTEPYLNSNTIVHYSNIQDDWVGIGNIDCDPIFLNPAEDDYHLQNNSPCIGAGIDEIAIDDIWYYAPEFDIEGNPRPNPTGSMPDIGAYENLLGEPQDGIYDDQLSLNNFNLSNYPNPFNPSTTINFSIQTDAEVELSIYNIKGQRIREWKIDPSSSNYAATRNVKCKINSIIWNGDNDLGEKVSSGIYYYELKVNGKIQAVKKCLLLK